MRLLIYLLALLSGFSVADVARADVTPASSVARASVAAADALVVQEQKSGACAKRRSPLQVVYRAHINAPAPARADNPITRYDTALQ
jgi:hypothetical protein